MRLLARLLAVLLLCMLQALAAALHSLPPPPALAAIRRPRRLGVPLINVLYKDVPYAGLLALPLIIYHALQVMRRLVWVTKWQRQRHCAPPLSSRSQNSPRRRPLHCGAVLQGCIARCVPRGCL